VPHQNLRAKCAAVPEREYNLPAWQQCRAIIVCGRKHG
jgi:hypothetical protein